MTSSLVGSEMCIRDRAITGMINRIQVGATACGDTTLQERDDASDQAGDCLLYTSDAADDM
eukprot:7290236-Prorocentrum_lima.AAC.1